MRKQKSEEAYRLAWPEGVGMSIAEPIFGIDVHPEYQKGFDFEREGARLRVRVHQGFRRPVPGWHRGYTWRVKGLRGPGEGVGDDHRLLPLPGPV